MSDIDTDSHKVIGLEEMRAAKHATLSRAELEAHMRDDHRITAITDVYDGILQLNTLNEAYLRMSHRRFHELAAEHQP
jgi:hypothetical protein